MANISNISIQTNDIPAAGQLRKARIDGEIGASGILQIISSNNQFYNFTTRTFTSEYTSNNAFSFTLTATKYDINILFPAATGVNYFLIVTPKVGNTFANRQTADIIQIGSIANTTLTIAASTASSAKYSSDPAFSNATLVGTSYANINSTLSVSKTITNATTDANSNGLFLTKKGLNPLDFFSVKTENVSSNPAGDATSSLTVVVADLSNLVEGMTLFYHKGTTAPTAGTVIKSINKVTKTLTFNNAVAFENGETMTFRAIGLNLVNKSLNSNIILKKQVEPNIRTLVKEISTTVRTAPSNSTTINVGATQGIPGGSTAEFVGFKVNNSSTNNVNAVTPDPDGTDTDGVITCDVNQTLTVGTKLIFTPVNKKHILTTSASVNFDLIVTKLPPADATIFLNLDNFVTPGAAS